MSNRISEWYGEDVFDDVHTAHHIPRVGLARNFVALVILYYIISIIYTYESRFGNWDEVVTW